MWAATTRTSSRSPPPCTSRNRRSTRRWPCSRRRFGEAWPKRSRMAAAKQADYNLKRLFALKNLAIAAYNLRPNLSWVGKPGRHRQSATPTRFSFGLGPRETVFWVSRTATHKSVLNGVRHLHRNVEGEARHVPSWPVLASARWPGRRRHRPPCG